MELLMGLEFRLVLFPFFSFFLLISHFLFPSTLSRFPLPILVTSVERLWIATLTRPLSYQLNQRKTKITKM